jgi:excisionase family DNA binding protein
VSRRRPLTLVGMTNHGPSQLEFGVEVSAADAHSTVPPAAQLETKPVSDTCAKLIPPRAEIPVKQPRGKRQPRISADRSPPLETEPLLTFADAARVLGISLRQFRRLVDGGKLAFVKVSERTPRVQPSELQRFLHASSVKYSEVSS